MITTSSRSMVRRTARLGLGALATALIAAPLQAQSVYPITNSDGTIVTAAASLYGMSNHCYPSGPITVCHWQVVKLYGDHQPVIVVVQAPAGPNSACYSGSTVQNASGYTRNGCLLTATAAAYGN